MYAPFGLDFPSCPSNEARDTKQHKLLLMRATSEDLVWCGATSASAKCLASGLDGALCDRYVVQEIVAGWLDGCVY
ncbi:hypothetical protein HBH56_112990 [Parastagonospora nodorum]|uniref:Uncharacterized protein n=1 Tax=Phaeosphaeria nodorum (strain SN15 / ATCC MYA-4574 / FGSC 10173) TaxID=321614 RepID=A0A7U2I830_PHANO|nr:hypothetical protein HBH56_112990 [Parastagonospora nodorum]QRD03543.1 hypothetical protein JI435_419740 [Parastagonospora nodorum SN15]KAH3921557.1 hypothetical protein HBH54_239480 [Parastagonospora nodorum]KAH3951157.1 hypothetical protein HBH53_068650 [Parastagonospora nodorum]KAH3963066.1 hypothetical protein HBH51_169320 [Parastagonospora nodorum]